MYHQSNYHSANDIFLNPGDFYFGEGHVRIKTLLGSCVAITLWHPRLRIGGMCHYLLPVCHMNPRVGEPDGRYAEDVIALFLRELKKNASQPRDYQVKMFGGGNQFAGQLEICQNSVSTRNIEVGRNLLVKHGFTINAEHLGGNGYRHVILDVYSGEIWLKHVEKQTKIVDLCPSQKNNQIPNKLVTITK